MAGMETVNSKDKKLESGEIIVMALHQIGTGDMPMATALAIIAREGTLETADTTQIGNTVFLAHRGTGDNKNKMVGRAFNVDTARNYINNCLSYIEYLRKKGITHYSVSFEGSEILKLIQFMQKVVKDIDTNIYIGQTEDDSYMAYFKFGGDTIPKAFK
tara:strand:+ start:479 stop:955 length:477 start_codon:yes stop_codon:yes gene_type:complete